MEAPLWVLKSLLQVASSLADAAAAPSLSANSQPQIPSGQCIMRYCLAMKVFACDVQRKCLIALPLAHCISLHGPKCSCAGAKIGHETLNGRRRSAVFLQSRAARDGHFES